MTGEVSTASEFCYDIPLLLQLFESLGETAILGSFSGRWASSRSACLGLRLATPQMWLRCYGPASNHWENLRICG